MPCRHCLKYIPAGAAYLVLAHRPFDTLQAYSETGPIFLCADPCAPAAVTDRLPAMLGSPHYIVRGYDKQEEIVYGSGAVVPVDEIAERAENLLQDPRIAFFHVRSARNNCFQCRIENSG